ncbi:chemotaxis protein CheY [Halobacterium litoreum]|uniref:Chemotaxis protein CheY n=1 Tax=Halobacterium litoreum TaxID=2039234 RepID=A0ABD5NAR6_9EURY|nr:chemotaxis protein CheY [Halobacterium litoreum]UHH12007.1 chemotaxis protein CheY [Halobacterium litoreum]
MAKQVLLVDDSEFMRNLLREILEEEFEIADEAENGVEAVEMYKEYEPDLVMMDIVMPIRDGIEATSEIKEYDGSAHIIMCTSIGQEEKMKKAVKAGADGYITKPFQKPSVMDAISDVLTA